MILIIDDNPRECQYLARAVRNMGYEVRVAQSAALGFHLANTLKPSLILTALGMENKKGVSICRIFHSDSRFLGVPIVLIGVADNVDARIQALSAGAIDILDKTIDLHELRERIRAYLRLVKSVAREDTELPQHQSDHVNLDKAIVIAVKDYIERNLDSLPTVQAIACLVGTHRERLSALFRDEFGCTVFAYARRMRIERSCTLLRETSMKIQDIATAVGFDNPGSFATAFKEISGLSPREYRGNGIGEKPAELDPVTVTS